MNETGKSAGTRPDARRYDDIIDLPRPVSASHPPMPLTARAAQFAPFAALTGHEAAIRETARLTEPRPALTEEVKAALNEKLCLLGEATGARPAVTVTYFRPDAKKAGGSYVRVSGTVKKLDAFEKKLVLEDGTVVPADEITALESPLFGAAEDGGC